jgi:hypothetical protein
MPVPPTWAVGQVLDSADFNTWAVGLRVIKTAGTSRTSNTTPTADPDLAVSLAASASYQIYLTVEYNGGTNGSADAQFGLTYSGTAASGYYWMLRHQITSLTLNDVLVTSFGTQTNVGTNGTGSPVHWLCTGGINTTTSGTLSFVWCQNSSSGTALTIMSGSNMICQRIN